MNSPEDSARLTVIYGPMFSDKTDTLIRLLDRRKIAQNRYQLFKDIRSDRGEGPDKVVSRSGRWSHATSVIDAEEILGLTKKDAQVVAVDEGQLLGDKLTAVVMELIYKRGKRVIVSGLATDFRDEPFGAIPLLIARADIAHQQYAVCEYREDPNSGVTCGKLASKTQRLIYGEPAPYDSPVVEIGDKERYQPRCSFHHFVPGRPY